MIYLQFSTPTSSPVPVPAPGSLIRSLCVIGKVGSGVQTVAINIAKALNKHDTSLGCSVHTLDFSYILSDFTSTASNSNTANSSDDNTAVYTRLTKALEALVHDIHTMQTKYSQKSTVKKDVVVILTIILSPIVIFRVPDLLTWLGSVTGCIVEVVVTVDSVMSSTSNSVYDKEVESGENRYVLYMYLIYDTIYLSMLMHFYMYTYINIHVVTLYI